MAGRSNVFARLREAAQGDLHAQRALVARTMEIASTSDEQIAFWALNEGLVIARMAALHGGFSDVVAVISMLDRAAGIAVRHGEDDIRSFLAGECVAWINYLADRGDENAATRLVEIGGEESPATMLFAQHFHELMTLGEKDADNAV
ncbi:hypothetical protein U8326_10040 [Tsuneonella sp. CC-YZS046]|uniref:hypothetical protein n=1 Tax=Tsuneonella sp. CC-YZS046 TaxID=3042152 RepID=UPI002D77F3D8|nr:hypothetical protein [Tsuneonella sp. CC-YZS046]WRO65401.1 hypothetical protein U8326_10040 [Tsuneonella sp. CC-YZS046]